MSSIKVPAPDELDILARLTAWLAESAILVGQTSELSVTISTCCFAYYKLSPILMKIRTRKLIGVIIGTLYFVTYSLVLMAIGGAMITKLHGAWQFLFFLIAGMAWLPVIMLIIRWMSRPDEEPDET